MHNRHLYNSDGDFLILPQQGTLEITTELGKLQVAPGEFCVIPRGIIFQVHLWNHRDNDEPARGYILEIYKGHFSLPELGPIGSNGLANARDFQYPVAWYEPPAPQQQEIMAQPPTSSTLLNKFGSQLWSKPIATSPYNVVAWHGNYLPFKYNLANFCAVNSVTYDHLDPSIYTVLTVTGDEPGTALVDFVIFPDPCTTPTKLEGGLAFMFETSCMLKLSNFALHNPCLEDTYGECWKDLPNEFVKNMESSVLSSTLTEEPEER
jgi:homogentisate 1,2-dioxygenase